MAKRIRYLIACLLLSLPMWRALAAEPAEDKARDLRFTVFAATAMPEMVYQITEQPAPRYAGVQFFPSSRSPVYEYRGWDALRFWDAKSHELLARVVVPKNLSQVILIFAPQNIASSEGSRYLVYVFDDSSRHLAPGELAILNLSGLRLTGSVGSTGVDLGPGYQGPFRAAPLVKINLEVLLRKRRIPSYANGISLDADQRGMLILLPPYRRGSVQVQYRLLLDEPTP